MYVWIDHKNKWDCNSISKSKISFLQVTFILYFTKKKMIKKKDKTNKCQETIWPVRHFICIFINKVCWFFKMFQRQLILSGSVKYEFIIKT